MAAGRLVFIHGRAQEHRDAGELKKSWLTALTGALADRNLKIELAEEHIRFPYYGQALFDMVAGKPADQVAEVIVKGPAMSVEERDFMLAVLEEVREAAGITDQELEAVAEDDIRQKGIANWEWVQRILIAIDRKVPGASAATIGLATKDVYEYLFNPVITDAIDDGVDKAMLEDVPTVVVAHSLGTVVAYKMLRDRAVRNNWNVPLFITLGSPLAVTAIRKKLNPHKFPERVGKWYNAMDERDVVSLYPLNGAHFPVAGIENKTTVDNHTDNRHGIAGYLDDKDVSQRIYDALKP